MCVKTGRKIRFKNRRAVMDAGIIILGVIVAIIAIIAATLTWSDILEVSFIKLLIEIPKFDYEVEAGHETGNQNFEVYQILRNIALVVLLFVIVFAGLSFMFEHINLVPPETGYQILSKSLIYVFFFFFFPPLWDLLAVTVEQTSMWIINPVDEAQPTKNVDFLLAKLGRIESPEFTLDAVVAGITDPFGALKNMFLTAFLATFKAIAFLIFMFLAFLFGTIRIVFTAIVTIGIPVILMLSLIPFFKRITGRFIDALLGLMIAPIFSALVIIAGVAHLQTLEATSPDPVVEWFAALAVMALATFIPAMIAPMLGSIVSSVSTVATGAISTGAIMTGMAGIGMAQGTSETIGRMTSQAREITGGANPLNLAKLAFSGPGFSTLAKAGLEGMGAGLSKTMGVTQGQLTRMLRTAESTFKESRDFTRDLDWGRFPIPRHIEERLSKDHDDSEFSSGVDKQN